MREFKSKKQDYLKNLITENPGITQTELMKILIDKKMLNGEKPMSARNCLSQMLISMKLKEEIYSKEFNDISKGGIPMNKWYPK